MEKVSSCDTKVIYETEFEAQVGQAKTEWKSGEKYLYYPCGRHYHLSHADPEKRRGVGKKHWKCPDCKEILRKHLRKMHRCPA